MYFDLIDLLALFGVYVGIIFVWGGRNGDRVLNGGRGKGQANMKGAATSVVAGTAAKRKRNLQTTRLFAFPARFPHPCLRNARVFFPFVFLFRPFFFAGGPFISGHAEKQGQDQELEIFQTHGPGG